MDTNNDESNLSPEQLKGYMQKLSQDLSACYLSSSMFTVVGVGIGTALSLQKKNVKYMALGAMAGTTTDAVYGFGFLCRDLSNKYQMARNAAYTESKKEEKRILDKHIKAIDNKS